MIAMGFSTKTNNVARKSLTKSILSSTTTVSSIQNAIDTKKELPIIIIPEKIWRKEAEMHKNHIFNLLKPGLTSQDNVINSGIHRRQRRREQSEEHAFNSEWTTLDPYNPVYNFLIEYYGIKGAKGPKRLARWCPDPSLLLLSSETLIKGNNNVPLGNKKLFYYVGDDDKIGDNHNINEEKCKIDIIIDASDGYGGIFLENATEDDIGGSGTLHLRGAVPILKSNQNDTDNLLLGVLYNPILFYNKPTQNEEKQHQIQKTIAPFEWYLSILKSTLKSDPILHCHGLHEWAMQYHPPNAQPPPSAKYQGSKNLPLRVSREVINITVERRGISCTHVDALRFFAPAAGPLNHHGSCLQRTDQLKLEQKACVHAHMDLLKIVLRLQPFVNVNLIVDVLEIALKARRLDVEASPYDGRSYGLGIIPVETEEGRKEYRKKQIELMHEAEPVRRRLLDAYKIFLELTFDEDYLGFLDDIDANDFNSDSSTIDNGYAAPERFSKAEPGGLPWRQNLIH